MSTLSSEQIIALLQATGGDLSLLKGKKLSPNVLLKAVSESPETLALIQDKYKKETSIYNAYDPKNVYDPAAQFNDIELKYRNMGPKYGQFATEFWDQVRSENGPSAVTNVVDAISKRKKDAMSKYGLNETEYNDMISSLENDAKAFQRAEVSRTKTQFAAYTKKRKELGLQATGGNAANAAVYQQTGLMGLGTMPTNIDQFIKRKSYRFKKMLEKKGKTDLTTKLLPQFEKQLREKVGTNFQDYAIADVLAQTLKAKKAKK